MSQMSSDNANTPPSNDSSVGWLGRLLEPSGWRFLLSTVGLVSVWVVGLKIWRLTRLTAETGALGRLTMLAADGLVCGALLVGGVGSLRLGRQLFGGRIVGRVLLQVVAGLVVVINGLAHFYFLSTGSVFEWSLVDYGLRHVGDVTRVIGSELTWGRIGLIALVFGVATGVPWRVDRRADREADPPVEEAENWAVTAGALAAALLLVGLSIPGVETPRGVGFGRESTVHLAVSGLSESDVPAEPGEGLDTDVAFSTDAGGRLVAGPETDKKNVVFIVLESTGAEAISLFGDDPDTTPFLRELADASLRLRRAYTTVPHTSKALVSIACGIPPHLDFSLTESQPGRLPVKCLPELLAEQEYRTAFFQSATGNFENRNELVEAFGFEEFFPAEKAATSGFDRVNYLGWEEAVMLGPSRRWLQQSGERPFFATYLTLTPHHDYTLPEGVEPKGFADDPDKNRYLNAVRHVDGFVEQLIDQYREMGVYKDTTFFIFADHGEAFGEHGLYQHDNVLYQEVAHIPWLIHRGDGAFEGREIDRRVSLLDLLPTVADQLGFRLEGTEYPGASVTEAPAGRTHFMSCFHHRKCLGMIEGDQKLIHHYGRRSDELYDLGDDWAEQTDLADEYAKRVEALRQKVLDCRPAANAH